LVEAGLGLRKLLHLVSDDHLGGTSAGEASVVLNE
jgi:hypothetical protein